MADNSPIHLERITRNEVTVRVEGITPLLTHAWSEKAKTMMRDKQGGKTRLKKEPKDPQAEYESAKYLMHDAYDLGVDAFGSCGMPAAAFKDATVQAARNFDSVTLVQAKQAIWIIGEGPAQLVRIEGKPEFTESPVRIAMGTADLRYRPTFYPWSATLKVLFNPVVFTIDAVVALVDAGGMGGVGEHRPSSPKSFTGSNGTYQVIEGP